MCLRILSGALVFSHHLNGKYCVSMEGGKKTSSRSMETQPRAITKTRQYRYNNNNYKTKTTTTTTTLLLFLRLKKSAQMFSNKKVEVYVDIGLHMIIMFVPSQWCVRLVCCNSFYPKQLLWLMAFGWQFWIVLVYLDGFWSENPILFQIQIGTKYVPTFLFIFYNTILVSLTKIMINRESSDLQILKNAWSYCRYSTGIGRYIDETFQTQSRIYLF